MRQDRGNFLRQVKHFLHDERLEDLYFRECVRRILCEVEAGFSRAAPDFEWLWRRTAAAFLRMCFFLRQCSICWTETCTDGMHKKWIKQDEKLPPPLGIIVSAPPPPDSFPCRKQDWTLSIHLTYQSFMRIDHGIDSLCLSAVLCWLQTSLPLTALPQSRVITAFPLSISELQLSAACALVFSPSGIAPNLK